MTPVEHPVPVEGSLSTVDLKLWRSDAIVLFDWLHRVDLDTIPVEHPAEKQALMDLFTRLEGYIDISYGGSGTGLTQAEIDEARAQVGAHMGW